MKNIIVIIITLSTMAFNLNAQQNSDKVSISKTTSYQIGDVVDDFILPGTKGENVSLSNFDNANGYIIVFTSNVCPFAIANEDRLTQINNELAPKGYPVIAINSNAGAEESLSAITTKVNEEKIQYTYLKDNISVFEKFGASKTPHVFLVDNNMKLQYSGSIDDSPRSEDSVSDHYLTDAVYALINNRKPDPAVTKSIGCPIKSADSNANRERKGPPNPSDLLARMDTNNDQQLTKDEVQGPLSKDFDALDVDNNGALSLTELSNVRPGKKREH